MLSVLDQSTGQSDTSGQSWFVPGGAGEDRAGPDATHSIHQAYRQDSPNITSASAMYGITLYQLITVKPFRK
jgi:hypothetical protein